MTQVMNMTKRLAALLLALMLVLGLGACGGPAPDSPGAPAQPSAPLASVPLESAPAQPAPSESAPAQPEAPASQPPAEESESAALTVTEDGWYHSKEEVALYLHSFGHLPDNYVTKRKAQDLGWTGGSVEPYAGEGTAIGGSRFGNYEGLLPEAEGRTYAECDIDTVGASSRGAKRIVFSNDGLIYYTQDHYESFELLYGEP